MKSWFKFFLPALYFLILLGAMLYAKLCIDPDMMDPNQILVGPTKQYLFGTDFLGRDYFYQVMMGSLISQVVGVLATLGILSMALFVVVILHFTQNRLVGSFLMMVIDVFQCLPGFLINTAVALFCVQIFSGFSLLPKTIVAIVFSISITFWMNPARLLSAKLNKILKEPFVEGVVAVGGSNAWLYMRHIFPHLRGTLWILFFIYFPQSILQETILSFLGFGVQSPYASWGSLMQQGFNNMQTHPHLMLFPAGMVFLTMMVFQISVRPAD